MRIEYVQESPYGEALDNLHRLITVLQNDDKTYTSAEIHEALTEIAAEALRIRKQIDRSARAYDVAHHTA